MNIEEIKKELEKENEAIYIREIEYNEGKYYMALKTIKNGIEYCYYEIIDGNIQEVKDDKLLKHFKNYYEINEDVIY